MSGGDHAVDLWQPWSLREVVGELRTGESTPQQVRDRAAERIELTEPYLNAWVQQPHPDSIEAAEGPGPLHGIPLGVKDIIDVRGWRTRCGSRLRAAVEPAESDAAIVRAWRAAGARPVGKTVTTEFAFFAPGPTRNPAAAGHTPGGSSSGSAAAVAAGQVPLALGSQTAGSVTRPAAYCGVAALVMTRGRFPTTGVTGLSESLDSHGFYTAGVGDLQLAWQALTGSTPVELDRPPRIALWDAAGLGVVQDPMAEVLARFAARLTGPAEVERLGEDGLVADLVAAHPVVMAYEAARERAVELAHAAALSAPLAALLRTGRDTADEDYRQARRVLAAGQARLRGLLEGPEGYDAILGPAAPGPAPVGLDATGDPVLSRPWQALGLPTLTLPGLRDDAGLPLGLQLVGPAGGEDRLLAVAARLADLTA